MYVLGGQNPIVYCPHNLIIVSFAHGHEYVLGLTLTRCSTRC